MDARYIVTLSQRFIFERAKDEKPSAEARCAENKLDSILADPTTCGEYHRRAWRFGSSQAPGKFYQQSQNIFAGMQQDAKTIGLSETEIKALNVFAHTKDGAMVQGGIFAPHLNLIPFWMAQFNVLVHSNRELSSLVFQVNKEDGHQTCLEMNGNYALITTDNVEYKNGVTFKYKATITHEENTFISTLDSKDLCLSFSKETWEHIITKAKEKISQTQFSNDDLFAIAPLLNNEEIYKLFIQRLSILYYFKKITGNQLQKIQTFAQLQFSHFDQFLETTCSEYINKVIRHLNTTRFQDEDLTEIVPFLNDEMIKTFFFKRLNTFYSLQKLSLERLTKILWTVQSNFPHQNIVFTTGRSQHKPNALLSFLDYFLFPVSSAFRLGYTLGYHIGYANKGRYLAEEKDYFRHKALGYVVGGLFVLTALAGIAALSYLAAPFAVKFIPIALSPTPTPIMSTLAAGFFLMGINFIGKLTQLAFCPRPTEIENGDDGPPPPLVPAKPGPPRSPKLGSTGVTLSLTSEASGIDLNPEALQAARATTPAQSASTVSGQGVTLTASQSAIDLGVGVWPSLTPATAAGSPRSRRSSQG